MNVSELQGAELDYWVAIAEGFRFWKEKRGEPKLCVIQPPGTPEPGQRSTAEMDRYAEVLQFSDIGFYGRCVPQFSTRWEYGGPIIEREHIALLVPDYVREPGDPLDNQTMWEAAVRKNQGNGPSMHGETPLIAAMRCFIASKYGETVEPIESPATAP